MAIGILCPKCKKTLKLRVRVCPCGHNLKTNRQYRVRVRMPSGKWKSQVVGRLSKAEKVEAKFKMEAVDEKVFDIPSKCPTIDTIWEKYLNWAKANKSSWRDDQGRWLKHVKPHFGRRRMDRITAKDVHKILDTMAKTGWNRPEKKKRNRSKTYQKPTIQPYSPATIQQVLTLIRRVYNWAYKRDLYNGLNPCDKVRNLKFDNKVTAALPKDQLRQFLKALDEWANERAKMVVLFALYSGQRRGQVLKLKWPDVDLDSGLIKYVASNTKNKESSTLPINKHCRDILKRAESMAVRKYVFPSNGGSYFVSFENCWKRFKKRNFLNFRFHDLRHTYASYLASSGKVDIYTLQHLLGHKSLSMTQRYAHLINGALERAAKVADDVLGL